MRGLRALLNLSSQVSFSTLVFFLGGMILFCFALIAYLLLVGHWEKTSSGERRIYQCRQVLLALFSIFWFVSLFLILVVDKTTEFQGEFAVYVIPFDPSSIFVEGYDLDYIMGDLGNWMSAPWLHQRRILVSLMNMLLFIPLGVSISAVFHGNRRYVLAAAVLLACAAGIEMIQLVTMSGVVYTDNILMRFLGGLIGLLVWRFVSNRFGEKA